MAAYTIPPALVMVLLSPTSTFDQRKEAVAAVAEDAWLKGWEACDRATEEALQAAGLPVARWHSLRATTITLLYEMDVPEVIIMAIAGHKNLETTRMYKGKTPKAMRSAADRMGRAIG